MAATYLPKKMSHLIVIFICRDLILQILVQQLLDLMSKSYKILEFL